MSAALTSRQRDVLKAIRLYLSSHGYPPTIRELRELIGVTSLRGTTVHIDALEKKGFLRRDPVPRGLTILRDEFGNVFGCGMTEAFAGIVKSHVEAEARRMSKALERLCRMTGRNEAQLLEAGYSRLQTPSGAIYLGIPNRPDTWVPLPVIGECHL